MMMMMSPLRGLEKYFHLSFSPTAYAVNHIISFAQAEFVNLISQIEDLGSPR
jgi:hypothetical protein